MKLHLWLALRLGKPTLPELYATMSGSDLLLWETWLTVDPQGEERADVRAAIVATAAARQYSHTARPSDFMPFVTRQEEKTETKPGLIRVSGSRAEWGKLEKCFRGRAKP